MVIRLTRSVLLLLVAVMVLIASLLFARFSLSYPNVSIKDHVLVVVWKAVYFIEPSSKDLKRVSKLHVKPEALSQSQCIACHGYMKEQRKTPDNSTVSSNVHFHLFATNASYSCVTCHRTGGVYSEPEKNRKEIYLGKVKRKKNELETETILGSTLKTNKQLCLNCHNSKTSNNLLWPRPHLETGWSLKHGMIFGKNKKVCVSCHKESIFCNNCHIEKPQTHFMIWRQNHKVAYKGYPDNCKTCHTTDFCNAICHGSSCDISNWLSDHATSITEKGTRFCLYNCHYQDYCIRCHSYMKPQKKEKLVYENEDFYIEEQKTDKRDWDNYLKKKNITKQANKKALWMITEGRSDQDKLSVPRDIDVDKQGNIYITDTGNNRILKYGSNHKLIMQWGGSNPTDIALSSSISIDNEDNLYVESADNDMVRKYSTSGKVLNTWHVDDDSHDYNIDKYYGSSLGVAVRTYKNGKEIIKNITSKITSDDNSDNYEKQRTPQKSSFKVNQYVPSIAGSDKQGNIYIPDDEDNIIKVFNREGEYERKWGGKGSGNGRFNNPQSVAVDKSGFVYVADTGNYRIQKFTSSGEFVRKWGGKTDNQFYEPESIVAGNDGNIYAVDLKGQAIYRLDKDNEFEIVIKGEGLDKDQLYFIKNVAVDSDGNIYLVEILNNTINKYNSKGKLLGKWKNRDYEDGLLCNPRSSAIDKEGNVYVADTGNNRIQKFDSNGKFIAKWGNKGSDNGQFNFPEGIAVDKNGSIYVADSGNNRIQKFNAKGKFLTKWGQFGHYEKSLQTPNGYFDNPTSIAIDMDNNIYVADSRNCRIQKFASTGKFISKWNVIGDGKGSFGIPCGLSIGSNNNIYIMNTNYNRIDEYTQNGKFVSVWGDRNDKENPFTNPRGVAFDNSGNIYIADTGNSRIQKYRLP